MSRIKFNFTMKLFLSHVVAILIVSGSVGTYFYHNAYESTIEQLRSRLLHTAAILSQTVDVNDLLDVRSTADVDLPGYQKVLTRLRFLRQTNPDVAYLYVMRREGEKLYFVIDSDASSRQAMPGHEYLQPTPSLWLGFDRPAVDQDIYQDEWGEFMSGFAPLSGGQGQYLLGLDMKADEVKKKLRQLQISGIISLVVSILMALVFSRLLAIYFHRPIVTLVARCQAIAAGKLEERVNARTGDEWDHLIGAFNQMSDDLGQTRQREQAAAQALRESKVVLEIKVKERTQDLEKLNGYLTIEVDERKRTETFLRIQQELALDGILVLDAENRYVSHNRRWQDLWALTSEQVVNDSLVEARSIYSSLVAPEQVAVFDQIKSAMSRRETGKIEYSLLSGRAHELYATPMIGRDGTYYGRAFFLRDVTDQKAAEDSWREINSGKDRLFSIIAHDLHNPFEGILSSTELLTTNIDNFSKEEVLSYLNTLNDSAEGAFKLLQQLLTWARCQMGHLHYRPEIVELWTEAETNLQLLRPLAESKKIELSNRVDHQAIAFGDPNMINTIIRNLLSNAVKFTQAGGRITLSTQTGADWVSFQVEDNGVGISAAAQEKLFKLSTNHTTLGTSNEKGTGLGLILVKELVECHGGRLTVTSAEGRGTTFRFSLPNPTPEQKGEVSAPQSTGN
jgi:signal transduction histidine kinase/HAMP domain-containing protein